MQLYIEGESVNIKPVNGESINRVNLWYSQWDSYGFATGRKKAEEALATGGNSFASGIYTKNGTIIGLIIGEFKNLKETVLWIRTFLIDTAWQRKKFGTNSFNMLCDYAEKQFNIKRICLSVSEKNLAGISFWRKMGMTCTKTLEFNEPERNSRVLIFEKVV